MSKFSNELSDAEIERLALLIEECAEVQQIACKILRHGYANHHPAKNTNISNRDELASELGDLWFAADFLTHYDLNAGDVARATARKREKVWNYFHHQDRSGYGN